MKKRKTIGLALGSGSARGLSHIGVLSVLVQNGIRPDFVAGTSIGAAVGALYCSGLTPEFMKKVAITTEWQDLLDFAVPKTGFLAGNNVEEYIQELTHNMEFKDLSIPLAVVALDIRNAKKVVFREGNVAKAVRASISIPAVFKPVQIDKHELVDGGLIDPIPVDVVREMGADIIIAVDLSTDLSKVYIQGSRVKERSSFMDYVKSRFIKTQKDFLKEFIMETKRYRLPHFIKKYIGKLVDWMFKPKRVFNFFTAEPIPHIVDITVRSGLIMSSVISQEKLKNSKVDVIIHPDLDLDDSGRFDAVQKMINAGEVATKKVMPKLLKVIKGIV